MDGPDPFAEVSFDDDFVRRARTSEPSAAERLERMARIARAHEALSVELDRAAAGAPPHPVRRPRWRGRRVIALVALVVLVALVGYQVFAPAAAAPPQPVPAPARVVPSNAPSSPLVGA